MDTIWIVIGLSVGGVIVAILSAWYRFRRRLDLGVMSEHWIAEQRLAQGPDPNR